MYRSVVVRFELSESQWHRDWPGVFHNARIPTRSAEKYSENWRSRRKGNNRNKTLFSPLPGGKLYIGVREKEKKRVTTQTQRSGSRNGAARVQEQASKLCPTQKQETSEKVRLCCRVEPPRKLVHGVNTLSVQIKDRV